MKKNTLGTTGFSAAPIAFGGNVFGWTIDEPTSFQILDTFIDAGFNLIDTADVYSRWKPGNQGGESETIIGNWLKKSGKRQDIILATKVGADMGQGKTDLTKSYILKAVEDSLRRLQTDVIDLYQSHWDDEGTPVEETLDAYAQLIKEGKVRAIGASNLSPERIHASVAYSKQAGIPVYGTLQPEYNLYDRAGYEQTYAPLAAEYNLGVIPYYSLASGFLTGKYRSEEDLKKSQRGGGIKKYLDDRGHEILNALDTISEKHNTTPAAVSLAWLMTRPNIVAPIASATSLSQLESFTKAAALELDVESLELLETASKY